MNLGTKTLRLKKDESRNPNPSKSFDPAIHEDPIFFASARVDHPMAHIQVLMRGAVCKNLGVLMYF